VIGCQLSATQPITDILLEGGCQLSATQPITGITLEGGSQLSTIPPTSGDGDSSDGGSVGVRV